MERQREIRQALNSFLPTPARHDTPASAPKRTLTDHSGPENRGGAQFAVTEAQRAVLSELQFSLRKHGIEAGFEEIGKGILDALAARPSLCKGLLAAYLLDL
ncbi:MAG TPA: hypothetical protein VKT77_12645 [Chthonomonadaceae bacterium]|nr:hypothetical protein [Chthonomonadaceae bacterium]